MRRRPAAVLIASCALIGACVEEGSNEGTKVFGENADTCPATVLTNDADDTRVLEAGAECFMVEFEAGRPVVWDVLVPTVEGDPILTRYDFDGDTVTITTDSTRDEFGNGAVGVQRCDGVRRSDFLPRGLECSPSSGDGFSSEGLPGGA